MGEEQTHGGGRLQNSSSRLRSLSAPPPPFPIRAVTEKHISPGRSHQPQRRSLKVRRSWKVRIRSALYRSLISRLRVALFHPPISRRLLPVLHLLALLRVWRCLFPVLRLLVLLRVTKIRAPLPLISRPAPATCYFPRSRRLPPSPARRGPRHRRQRATPSIIASVRGPRHRRQRAASTSPQIARPSPRMVVLPAFPAPLKRR
jgi:hypothetical protein